MGLGRRNARSRIKIAMGGHRDPDTTDDIDAIIRAILYGDDAGGVSYKNHSSLATRRGATRRGATRRGATRRGATRRGATRRGATRRGATRRGATRRR